MLPPSSIVVRHTAAYKNHLLFVRSRLKQSTKSRKKLKNVAKWKQGFAAMLAEIRRKNINFVKKPKKRPARRPTRRPIRKPTRKATNKPAKKSVKKTYRGIIGEGRYGDDWEES